MSEKEQIKKQVDEIMSSPVPTLQKEMLRNALRYAKSVSILEQQYAKAVRELK